MDFDELKPCSPLERVVVLIDSAAAMSEKPCNRSRTRAAGFFSRNRVIFASGESTETSL
jgi:hypothetical protein